MRWIKLLLLFIFFEVFHVSAAAFPEPCPKWMKEQIDHDIGYYKKAISLKKLERFFQKNKKKYYLVKFTICDNHITTEHELETSHSIHRMDCFKSAFEKLSQQTKLPSITFLISMHDEIYNEFDMPVFTMAKEKDSHFILLPDFEALNENYQVLKGSDITQLEATWTEKKSQMVWRGSSGQRNFNGDMEICAENLTLFSRVKLCQIAQQFPLLIDAGFTSFIQVKDPQLLDHFKKEYIDYEQQIDYKYHLLIDGNTSSFSNSGWKFFINSAVFIPESTHTQWFYHELIPYVHYIPVAANLDDLVDKVAWAVNHDEEVARIALNAREFAKDHLTIKEHLTYLYYLLLSYSQLKMRT